MRSLPSGVETLPQKPAETKSSEVLSAMSGMGGKRTYTAKSGGRQPYRILVVDRLIETAPQRDWPASNRWEVGALLPEQHCTGNAHNEPHDYRTEDIRLHRCLLARSGHRWAVEPE